MDHGDPFFVRHPRILDHGLFAAQDQFAFVRFVDPVQNLHQRRFPGSVFTDQDMHFSFPQSHIDFLKCFDTREEFADLSGFQNNTVISCVFCHYTFSISVAADSLNSHTGT